MYPSCLIDDLYCPQGHNKRRSKTNRCLKTGHAGLLFINTPYLHSPLNYFNTVLFSVWKLPTCKLGSQKNKLRGYNRPLTLHEVITYSNFNTFITRSLFCLTTCLSDYVCMRRIMWARVNVILTVCERKEYEWMLDCAQACLWQCNRIVCVCV